MNASRALGLKSFQDNFFKVVAPSPTYLSELTSHFLGLIAETGIDVASLYEAKKTIVLGQSLWSAVLGIPGECIIPINTDHANLCKFTNSKDTCLVTTINYRFLYRLCAPGQTSESL